MAYVPVPKDLNAVKTKVLFNLTKRQLVCFGSGAAVAVPLFFLCKTFMNTTVAAILMILTLLPFMLMAMYEKNGQPLEKIVRNIVLFSVLIYELVGPVLTKIALTKAGNIEPKPHEKHRKHRVAPPKI